MNSIVNTNIIYIMKSGKVAFTGLYNIFFTPDCGNLLYCLVVLNGNHNLCVLNESSCTFIIEKRWVHKG